MNKIKKISFFFLMMTFWISITTAQMHPGMPNPEERAKRLAEMLKTELKLDIKQSKKVQDIVLKYSKRIDTLRTKSKNRDEVFELMRKIQAEQDNEIKKVLTEEQYKKYQKIMSENRSRMRRKD